MRRCLVRCPYSPHRLAPQVEQELLESGALDGIISLSPTGEPEINRELGSALDRKEWVHICRDISDLAGAKRVPHPTLPLPLQVPRGFLAPALTLALAETVALAQA